VLLVASGFFSSAIYTVVGPYMSEIWPRGCVERMGFCYGVGNLSGKVMGPFGLALIMGAGDIISRPRPISSCSARPLSILRLVHSRRGWLLAFGHETKGRTLRGDGRRARRTGR